MDEQLVNDLIVFGMVVGIILAFAFALAAAITIKPYEIPPFEVKEMDESTRPCGICEFPKWIHEKMPHTFDHIWEPYPETNVSTDVELNSKTSNKIP